MFKEDVKDCFVSAPDVPAVLLACLTASPQLRWLTANTRGTNGERRWCNDTDECVSNLVLSFRMVGVVDCRFRGWGDSQHDTSSEVMATAITTITPNTTVSSVQQFEQPAARL